MANKNFKFKKKVADQLPTFTDSVEGLSGQDLEKNILIYAKHLEETKSALQDVKEGEEYVSLKNQLDMMTESFNESIKLFKMKITYLHILLTEKGGETTEE